MTFRLKNIVSFVMLMLLVFSFGSLEASRQSISGRARPYFLGARTELSGQRYDLALERFLKVLEYEPNHVESRMTAADLIVRQAAEAAFEADILSRRAEATEDEDAAQELRERGRAYEERSRELYKEAYRHYVIGIETILSIPNWQRFTGQQRSATFELFKTNAEANTQRIFARLFAMGDRHLEAAEYDIAERIYYEIIELIPSRFEPYVRLAQIADRRGEPDKAIGYFKKVLEVDPANTQIILNIATEYGRAGDWENAKVYYRKFIEREPNNIDGYFYLAVAYLQTDNFETSLRYFEEALAIEPDNLDLLDNAARVAESLGNTGKAVGYLMRLVELEETVGNIAYLCSVLARLHRWEDLITYSKRWLELYPGANEAVRYIIFAANQVGNTELVRQFQRVLEGMN